MGMRRFPVALIGAALGSLLTASFIYRPQSPTASSVPQDLQIQIPALPLPGDDEAQRWAALRRTACDGPPLGPRRFNIPQSASIGRFANAAVQLLRTLNRREDLAKLSVKDHTQAAHERAWALWAIPRRQSPTLPSLFRGEDKRANGGLPSGQARAQDLGP
jgi:hypothetical protein